MRDPIEILADTVDRLSKELEAAKKELEALKSEPQPFTRDDLLREIGKIGRCEEAARAVTWITFNATLTPQELWDICPNKDWMLAWIDHVQGSPYRKNEQDGDGSKNLYYSWQRLYPYGPHHPEVTPDWIRFVYPVFHYPGSDAKFRR